MDQLFDLLLQLGLLLFIFLSQRNKLMAIVSGDCTYDTSLIGLSKQILQNRTEYCASDTPSPPVLPQG